MIGWWLCVVRFIVLIKPMITKEWINNEKCLFLITQWKTVMSKLMTTFFSKALKTIQCRYYLSSTVRSFLSFLRLGHHKAENVEENMYFPVSWALLWRMTMQWRRIDDADKMKTHSEPFHNLPCAVLVPVRSTHSSSSVPIHSSQFTLQSSLHLTSVHSLFGSVSKTQFNKF